MGLDGVCMCDCLFPSIFNMFYYEDLVGDNLEKMLEGKQRATRSCKKGCVFFVL